MERTQVGAAGAVGVLLAGLAGLPPADALLAGSIVALGTVTEGMGPLLEVGAEHLLGVEIPMVVTELPQHVVGLAAASGVLNLLFGVAAGASIAWIATEVASKRSSSS